MAKAAKAKPMPAAVTVPEGIATAAFGWSARGQLLNWSRGSFVRVDGEMQRDMAAGGAPVLWGDDMAIYSGDQQQVNTACVNGQIVRQDAVSAKASAVAGGLTAYTFTDNWTHMLRGHVTQFRKGLTYGLTTADAAALVALSAPMSAA